MVEERKRAPYTFPIVAASAIMQKCCSLLASLVTFSCFLLFAKLGNALSLTHGPPLGPYKRARQNAVGPLNAAGSAKPYIEQCKVYFRNATLDHFSWVRTS